MNGRLQLFTLACLLGHAATCHAGRVITISDLQLAPGQQGTIDVLIESDSDTAIELSFYGAEFRIISGATSRLEFVDPQWELHLDSSDYLLADDSFNVAELLPGSVVDDFRVPNDTVCVTDATDSGDPVFVTMSRRLLARLDVTTVTDLSPKIGDTFTVELIGFDFDDAEVQYRSLAGTVTIVAPSATVVPEPSSLQSGLLLFFVLVLFWRPHVIGTRVSSPRSPSSACR